LKKLFGQKKEASHSKAPEKTNQQRERAEFSHGEENLGISPQNEAGKERDSREPTEKGRKKGVQGTLQREGVWADLVFALVHKKRGGRKRNERILP